MKNCTQLCDALNLTTGEVVADRRGSLVLKATLNRKPVVLKTHSLEGTPESIYKARLLVNEGETLSQMGHLTNDLYIAHGECDGRVWLLTRDLSGCEVSHVAHEVRRSAGDSAERSGHLMELLLAISQFYSTLYAGGYMHGDVQPGHIYLEGDKSRADKVTVIDWGLSAPVNQRNSLYRGGFVYFIAPEIAEKMLGKEGVAYTAAAEVYALGATLFSLFTGYVAVNFGVSEKALQSLSLSDKLIAVTKNRIRSFSEVSVSQHAPLEALLQTSLATNPQRRFKDPIDFHDHLSALW